MGGGNAQKSAIARAKKMAKAGKEGAGGGGAAGIQARGGNLDDKLANAAAERAVSLQHFFSRIFNLTRQVPQLAGVLSQLFA
jgi:hypothetical protein